MRYLFIHQNFPGQFRHLAKALAAQAGNEVVAVGDAANLRGRPLLHPAIRTLAYTLKEGGGPHTHHYIREYEGHIRRGQCVTRLLLQLRDQEGFVPDVVVAHPGWGEGLFLKDVFPQARHVQYFEYFYRGSGGDVGFDPEFPATLDDQLRVRIKNSTQLQSLLACDQGIAPTQWQKSLVPPELQDKVAVVHEGVDTQQVRPDAGAWLEINGQRLQAGDPIVTYVARNLEPYRGFHTFMRSLPALQARCPQARVIIVGGDGVSYGKRLPEGESYRQRYCDEVREQVDWRKVFVVGKLPYADYLRVLQVSAVHVYLTYPFVLSWSMLEAMSAGCLLLASATAPVQEVIRDGENGLLTDFFDPAALADKLATVLSEPARYQPLREAARATVCEHYDLNRHCLPRMLSLLAATP